MIESLAQLVWLVPLLPLLAAILTAIFGCRLGKFAAAPTVLGIGASAVIALTLLIGHPYGDHGTGHPASTIIAMDWLKFTDLTVPIEFRLDALSTMMISMVTFVATLIAIFAAGYMSDDSAKPRFFAIVSLFVAAMTGLVLSNNFVVTYGCWEGVGVCSYLLIGHYHHKHSAAAASKKAFLMNRIGDVGFALAIFLMWISFNHSVRYDDVLSASAIQRVDTSTIACIALLLLWAATAKSAQVPLYTWLPDAMEGPTPVSALIHAATMVTAGVYLVARASLLFAAVPAVQALITAIGLLTALIAAFIALTQYDLKRVLAYSTVSQLGFMFMALGAGVGDVAQMAVIAAMFHLLTHAFFKALLFLGSGSVMHSMGNVIDMRRFGGLGSKMPVTCITFGIGALALAGFPLTSGFFSKDEILIALNQASKIAPSMAFVYTIAYWGGLFTAFLTAFYVGRAFCMTFLGKTKLPSPKDPEADPEEAHHHHGHGHSHGHGHHKLGEESAWIMLAPLCVLAVLALGAGFANHTFSHYLASTPGLSELGHADEAIHDEMTMTLGSIAGVAGLILAWLIYGLKSASFVSLQSTLMKLMGPLPKFASNKFLVDEGYQVVVKLTYVFTKLSASIDVLQFLIVEKIASLPRSLGRLTFARYQNGLIQSYAAASALAVAFLLIVLLLSL